MTIIKPSTAFKAGADWVSGEVRAYMTDQVKTHVDTVQDVRDSDFEQTRFLYVRTKAATYRLDLSSGAPDDGDAVLQDNVGRRYVKVPGSGSAMAWDVQVDDLTGRAGYDGEEAGFSVLVADAGSGRAAIYERVGAAGNWTDPAYLTPATGGNVSGPVSATDGHVAVFDGVTGKLIKDGGFVPADASAFAAHVADDDNPHSVTKAQVGLGAVDNTADADKPLSTAMTTALAAKADAIARAGLASRWIGDELRAAAIDCRAQAAMVRDIYGEVPAVAGRPEDLMAFERLSGGSYVGRDGLMRFAASGEPRYSHDPVTLEPLGLLVERASTNLVAGPSLIAADWTITNSPIITQAATQAPDGSMTGVRWERGSADPYASRGSATVSYVTGTRYTGGYCFKRDPGSPVATTVRVRLHSAVFGGVYRDVSFNLTTEELSTEGSPEGYGAIRLPGGWWYVWVSHTATSTVTSWAPLIWPVTGTLGSSFYLWHAQFEVGARPTSLIRNLVTNEANTRAADTVSVPVSSLPFNPAEGTILFEGDTTAILPSTSAIIAGLSGQVRRALAALTINAGGVIQMSARDASNQFGTTLGSVLPGERFRAAMAFDASGRRGSLNGAAVVSSAGTVSFVPTQFQMGYNVVGGEENGYRLGGALGRVIYIPRAFSNGELQAWAGA